GPAIMPSHMLSKEDCFLCRKHEGKEAAPPGGYLYADARWMVCHAAARLGPLGTLFLESRRHFLDYSEMTGEEAASLGSVLQKVFEALREQTGAERIYQVVLLEGVPHYHAWLVPRRKEDRERGMRFLARDDSCTEEDAVELASRLRRALA
ncbi:MAG: HIT family protein, partial [Bacteroidota bacterium]